MNKKLLLQDLTDQLAEAGRIKKKDAEEFLRVYFRVAEDALFEDGLIKIAGLGTLKLVKVEARKSVNVTTGEEFEIKEHFKISFLPDAGLKESVNRPYAHLEPVELDAPAKEQSAKKENPEQTEPERATKKTVPAETPKSKITEPVTNDSIRVVSENTGTEKMPVNSAEKSQPETQPTVDKDSTKKNTEKEKTFKRAGKGWWFAVIFLIAALTGWALLSNHQKSKENQQKISEMELIDSLENESSIQDELASNTVDSSSVSKDSISDSKPVTQSAEVQKNNVKETGKPVEKKLQPKPESKTTKPVASVLPTQIKASKPVTNQQTKSSPVERTVPLTTAPPSKKTLAEAKKTEKKPTIPPARVKAPTTEQTRTAKKGLKNAELSKNNSTTPAASAKPVVKQAKTTTSGTTTTVKLEPGDRLTLLALKYYGHKAFWVYIYQANQAAIKNPDNVPAGTTLRIPQADPAKINAGDPKLIAKAQALQSQILKR